MEPVFIFSQPRSGSTLLQKILGTHSEIYTTAEPWLLLPLSEIWNSRGSVSYYGHSTASSAIKEMFSTSEDSWRAHKKAVRKYVKCIYSESCYDAHPTYFLDKTPRYYWIINEIAEIFPDAKFIFLMRNPLSVLFSMVNAWGQGGFKHMHAYIDDILHAPSYLVSAANNYRERSLVLKYEDLVFYPEEHLKRVLIYLQLDYEEGMLDKCFNINIQGSLGDDVGEKKYKNVLSNESVDAWCALRSNVVRKYIAKYVMKKIGVDTVDMMGYDYDLILSQLKEQSSITQDRLLNDFCDISVGFIKVLIDASVRRNKKNYLNNNGFPVYFQ